MLSIITWGFDRSSGFHPVPIRSAFIVAALVRICVGSATVAMTMAAGIIAAMPGIADLSPLYLACTTAAVAGR